MLQLTSVSTLGLSCLGDGWDVKLLAGVIVNATKENASQLVTLFLNGILVSML